MKHLLTIAGSDSSGGAGIQADLKTFAAHGTFGMSVITAVTAQNTCGVTLIQDITPEMITAQIDAVFSDIHVDAVKVGMISRSPSICAIAKGLRKWKPAIVVLDPVMVSKSGFQLLQQEACETLIQELLPLATLVTPNMPEAEAICGFPITSEKEMAVAAQRIMELGAKAVMVKGCRLMNDQSNDYLYDGTKGTWLSGTRIETKNTHGTGCTLSSALAANLANGIFIEEAARNSKAYVTKAIAHSLPLGNGCGPTHHFVDLYEQSGLLQS